MQTPVISAALLGSGYNLQGQGHQQSRGQRPSSAGHSRGSGGGGHHHHSSGDGHSSHRQQTTTEMPALNSSNGGGGSSRSGGGGNSYMRPKSAGAVRQGSSSGGGLMNVEGHGGTSAMQQQQMYYQQHMAQQQMQQQQLKQQQKMYAAQQQRASSSGGTRPSQGAQQPQAQAGQQGSDHWSTSYKLHYGYGTDANGGSALQNAAKGGPNEAVGVTDGNKPPSSQRPSSATARIRTAVPSASQKYALPADGTNPAVDTSLLQELPRQRVVSR